MTKRLFSENIDRYREEQFRVAQRLVQEASEAEIESGSCDFSALCPVIQLDVARLLADEIHGRRRRELRTPASRADDGEVLLIDVTIPFDGSPKSFHIAPPDCVQIERPAETEFGAKLVATFPDDDDIEHNVEEFITQVRANITKLRPEIKRIQGEVMAFIKEAVEQRKARMMASNARARKISFPVE